MSMIQINKVPKKGEVPSHMSAEELKFKLQQHFTRNGTINSLKTQLRNQLVSELFRIAHPLVGGNDGEIADAKFDGNLLPLQVSNWLVYDHLKRQGYDYTLSTFVSEAGISFPEKLLSFKDIADLFGLRNENQEFDAVTKHYSSSEQSSFLYSLFSCVMKQHSIYRLQDLKCNKYTSTNENGYPPKKENAAADFQQDSFVNNDNEIFRSNLTFPESSSNYLEIKQQKLYEVVQSEKEEHMREAQKLRQRLLSELDRLYEHEQQVKLELEQRKRRLSREQDLLDLEKRKLQARELELAKQSIVIEKEMDGKHIGEEENLSLVLKRKEEEYADREVKLKQEQQRLNEEKFMINVQKEEITALRNQVQQYDRNLQSASNKNVDLLTENAVLKEKLEHFADSEKIKMELMNNLKGMESYQMQVKEFKEKNDVEKQALLNTVYSLRDQLNLFVKKKEIILKDVGVSTETFLYPEKSILPQKGERLENELRETKSLYQDVIHRLEDQNDNIQRLHETIHTLHAQLMETNLAMHIAKVGTSKLPLPPTPSLAANLNTSQIRTALHTNESRNQIPLNSQYPGLYYPLTIGQRNLRNDPYKFISEAKKHINELEQQEQVIRKKYSAFLDAQSKLSQQENSLYQTVSFTESANQSIQNDGNMHFKDISMLTSRTLSNDQHYCQISGQYLGNAYQKNVTLHVDECKESQNDKQVFQSQAHAVDLKYDGMAVSQSRTGENPDAFESNKTFAPQTHGLTISSHKYPISSNNLLGMSKHQIPSNSVHASQFDHINAYRPGAAAVINSTPASLANQQKDFTINHPFHLTKFGLPSSLSTMSTVNQDVSHTLASRTCDSVSKNQDKCETTNCKQVDYIVGRTPKNLETSVKETHSNTSDVEILGLKHSEQIRTNVSTASSGYDNSNQNALLNKQIESENYPNFSQSSEHSMSAKSNEDIDSREEAKCDTVKFLSVALNETPKECTDSEIMGIKCKKGVALRSLSVDLDLAWKQKTASVPSAVRTTIHSRSGSCHSLPSKFDHTVSFENVPLKLKNIEDFLSDKTSEINSFANGRRSSIDKDDNFKVNGSSKSTMNLEQDIDSAFHDKSDKSSKTLKDVQSSQRSIALVDLDSAWNSEQGSSNKIGVLTNQTNILRKSSITEHDVNEFGDERNHIGDTNDPHGEKKSTYSLRQVNPDPEVSSQNQKQHEIGDMLQIIPAVENLDSVDNVATVAELDLCGSLCHSEGIESPVIPNENDKYIDSPCTSNFEPESVVLPDVETDQNQSGEKTEQHLSDSARDNFTKENSSVENTQNLVVDVSKESTSELSDLNLSAGEEQLNLSKGEESDW